MGLKIQVNGKGMIPRGYGLAPRKEPFSANDFSLIGLILNTPGLSIKYLNPERNVLLDLTKKNAKTVWDKYSSYVAPAQNPEKTEQPKEIKKEDAKLPEAGDIEAKKEPIKVELNDKPEPVTLEENSPAENLRDEEATDTTDTEAAPAEEKTTEQVVPASQQAVITPAQSPKQNKGGNGTNKNAKH